MNKLTDERKSILFFYTPLTLLLKNFRVYKYSKKNFTIIQRPKKITVTRFLRAHKHNNPSSNICSVDAFTGQNTIPAAP